MSSMRMWFLAIFFASCVAVTFSIKLPLCENSTDLSDYYASIFAASTESYVVKRESRWTFSCLHASIIQDENNASLFSHQVYECCGKCEFPTFSLCALASYPDWMCGSEAYDCVFKCRDEDSVLEAVVQPSSLGLTRKRQLLSTIISEAKTRAARKGLKRLRKEKKCFQKECKTVNGVEECCRKSTCIDVSNFTVKLEEKKKARGRQKNNSSRGRRKGKK